MYSKEMDLNSQPTAPAMALGRLLRFAIDAEPARAADEDEARRHEAHMHMYKYII